MGSRLTQTLQKLSILKSCDSTPTAIIDLEGEGEDSAGALAKRSLGAMGFGGMRAETTQLYAFRTARGGYHFYAQPFAGRLPFPGEHHVWLPTPISAPAVYEEGILGGKWTSPSGVHKRLKAHLISKPLGSADFTWKLGAGEVKRAWYAQLRPLRGGTHFVMKGTGESDVSMNTRPVGFTTFVSALTALMTAPVSETGGPDTPFIHDPVFSELFVASVEQPLPAQPRRNTAGREFGQPLHQLFTPHVGKRVHVHPLPPKIEKNAKKRIIPAAAHQLPIVAMVDFTMMGSGKEGLVFTPTHGFLRQNDESIHFEWSEIRSASVFAKEGPALTGGDLVRLELAERGMVYIDADKHAPLIAQALANFATLPDLG